MLSISHLAPTHRHAASAGRSGRHSSSLHDIRTLGTLLGLAFIWVASLRALDAARIQSFAHTPSWLAFFWTWGWHVGVAPPKLIGRSSARGVVKVGGRQSAVMFALALDQFHLTERASEQANKHTHKQTKPEQRPSPRTHQKTDCHSAICAPPLALSLSQRGSLPGGAFRVPGPKVTAGQLRERANEQIGSPSSARHMRARLAYGAYACGVVAGSIAIANWAHCYWGPTSSLALGGQPQTNEIGI